MLTSRGVPRSGHDVTHRFGIYCRGEAEWGVTRSLLACKKNCFVFGIQWSDLEPDVQYGFMVGDT